MMYKTWLRTSVSALCVGALPTLALAQDAPASEGESAPIDEIIVTAERRESTLQSVPISVTALTAEDLARHDIAQVSDALRQVPSVALNQSAKGGQVFIRGVGGALDSQIGSPAVNFNLDGIYQGQAAPVFAALYDVNRVEVLRGPQGTLYGRNATAGSVNVITNNPSDEFEVQVSATLGNYDLGRIEGMLNVPVSDRFALRAAFVNEERDGYLSNGYADSDTTSARIRALIDFTESASLVLSVEHSEMNGVPGTVIAPLTAGRIDPGDAWEAADPGGGYENAESTAYIAQFDVDLGFADLTFMSAYQDFSLDFNRFFAGQNGDQTSSDEQTSHELRLASPSTSPIEWVVGLYYLESNKTDLVYTGASNSTTDYPEINQESTAVFGQLRLPISTDLSVHVGGRYTEDSQFNRGRVYPGTPNPANATAYFTGEGEWENFDYRLGVEYQLGEQSMLYAQVASGYKAGGLYQGGSPNTYEPETLTAYSIGSKNRFSDGAIQVNAEAFHYDYQDYQVQTIGPINPVGFGLLVFNSASAIIYGGEIESIFMLSANDRIDFSLSYIHGQFGDNFVVPNPFFGPANYSNFPVPHAPEWSGRIGYEHVWPIAGGAEISVMGDVEWSQSYWPEFTHIPGSHQSSFTRSNAALQYSAADAGWSIRAFVRNIEDEPVIESAYRLPFSPSAVQLAAPRTYGVTLMARF